MSNKINPFKKNKHEIMWNIINSGLAALLVFLGSLTDGIITWKGVGFSLLTAVMAFIIQFQLYWKKQEKEYSVRLFAFIHP